jgi:hypothetical protein
MSSAPGVCGHCGKIARGYAKVDDVQLCHPDEGMDCYRLVTVYKAALLDGRIWHPAEGWTMETMFVDAADPEIGVAALLKALES